MTAQHSPIIAVNSLVSSLSGLAVLRTAARRAIAILFCLPCIASAAELLPPLQALRTNTFTLVVAEPLEAPASGRQISLKILEVLRGPAPEESIVHVAALEHEIQDMVAGTPYLVVYNEVERDRFQPRKQVRRPHNRQLVRVDGASPAVFPDSPEIRELLAPEHRSSEQQPAYRQKVLSGLSSSDPAMVDLWSAELALRPGTFAQLTDPEIAKVQAIVAADKSPPDARSRLLIVALDREPAFGLEWYEDSAASLLNEYSPDALVNRRGLDQLIYNAMVILQKRPNPAATIALKKWLSSTPSLAENAAWALREIDPAQERSAVEEAIGAELTPEATRRMLVDYLRRLKLLDAKRNS